MDEALDALLDRIDRGRKKSPAKPKPVLPGLRRIPEWVKDAVWKRDGGRCAFQGVDGARCEASEWLEYDHIRPFALGGTSDDPDNVRLLCRAHNQHRAREDFGDAAWTGGSFAEEGAG
jgi:5-methylcytosine-specific restriction endonuclease McrA